MLLRRRRGWLVRYRPIRRVYDGRHWTTRWWRWIAAALALGTVAELYRR